MEKIFKDKKMTAVSNSKGNVDTSDWFSTLSKR